MWNVNENKIVNKEKIVKTEDSVNIKDSVKTEASVNIMRSETPGRSVIREKYRELTLFLIGEKLTITTMESATSGQIASLITDTEGASAIFKGAYITYSNEAKIKNGVPKDIIDQYSVYSTETADAMAKACAEAYHADIGIGITGTTGNVDPANPEASVPGQVFFSICYHGKLYSYQKYTGTLPTRLDYKFAVADAVYEKLTDLIHLEKTEKDG